MSVSDMAIKEQEFIEQQKLFDERKRQMLRFKQLER